jgi:hypothetical protein
VSERPDSPERTLDAIASAVGLDGMGAATPREVFLAVKRCVREHESMRVQLARLADVAEDAVKVLRGVDEP